ncbi:MAG TPA: cytochrome c oxidase subunit II [Planctomycetota bacterium]|nr:cytochrome c oxidase subunit II [Planctomycetota bacterium]
MSARWRKVAALLLGVALCAGMSTSAFAAGKWPNAEGYWLPEAASTYAEKIDGLFYAILWLTGIVFVVTELLLLVFIIKYRKQEGRRSIYTHGSHKLEMVWTLTPALILAVIALVQRGTWNEIKTAPADGPDVVKVQLFGEQFQWNFRYAGNDGKWGTKDDIRLPGTLYVPKGKKVVIEQTSKDVIHSLFLPYMRLKQDLVPGMWVKCWFEATKSTAEMQAKRSKEWNYEIVCAELCGNGHSEMGGLLFVLEPAEYDAWLKKTSEEFAKGEWDTLEKLWSKWPVNEDGTRKIATKVATEEPKKAPH